MILVEQPQDWMPVYNNWGTYTFQDGLNANMPEFPFFYIGAPSPGLAAFFNFNANDLVLANQGNAYSNSAFVAYTGGYVKIQGTQNYDGIRLIKFVFGAYYILDGEGGAVETEGTMKTYLNNMEAYMLLNIEDEPQLTLRQPSSADNMFRISVHDYIKRKFYSLFRFPQSGGRFTIMCTSIRYNATRYGSEFDQSIRTWNDTLNKWEYSVVRKTVHSGAIGNKVAVNTAANYYMARAFGLGSNLSDYVATSTSDDRIKFLTYRPRTTYITSDENALLTHLKGSNVDYFGIVQYFNSAGMQIGSQTITADNNGYTDPHHMTWNVGTRALTVPANTAYYSFFINVAGDQRTEKFFFHLKSSCNMVKMYWKNEFGALDDYMLMGITQDSNSVGSEVAGTPDILSPFNPGNMFKFQNEGMRGFVFNTGLINTEHAKWLKDSLSACTECMIELQDAPNGIPYEDKLIPVIIDAQSIGSVQSNKRTHNLTFEAEIAFNVHQVGNPTK